MICKTGLEKGISSLLGEETFYKYDKKNSLIKIVEHPTLGIDSSNKDDVAIRVSEMLNSKLNQIFPQLGDIAYPSKFSSSPYGTIQISPTFKQYKYLNSEGKNIDAHIEDLRVEKMEKDFLKRVFKDWKIDKDGNLIEKRSDIIKKIVQDLSGNTYSVNESEIITYETDVGPIRYIIDENGDMVMLSSRNTDVVETQIIPQQTQEINELFESNPELANEVYEALGFSKTLNSKEVREVIDKIKSENKPSGILFRALDSVGAFNNIKSITIEDSYSSYSGVQINGNIRVSAPERYRNQVIAHEFLHSVTEQILTSYYRKNPQKNIGKHPYKDRPDIKSVPLSKTQIDALDKIVDIFKLVENSNLQFRQNVDMRANATDYGLDNLDEFFSEAFSNPYFIEQLKTLPSINNKRSNLFQDFVEAILKMFGIENTITLYDDIVNNFEEIFINPLKEQKQQAQQLYAQYLEQNPNGNVEGFKNWVGSNNPQLQKDRKDDLRVANLEYLEEVLDTLSSRFGLPYEIIFDENNPNKGYVDVISYKQPTIIINASKATSDTPLHEYGHIFINLIRASNKNLYSALIKEVLNTEQGKKELKAVQEHYVDYTLEEQIEETIVQLLGEYAAGNLDSKTGLHKTIKKIWNSILEFLSKAFNVEIKDISPNTSIESLAKLLANPNINFNQKSFIEKNIESIKKEDLKRKERLEKEYLDFQKIKNPSVIKEDDFTIVVNSTEYELFNKELELLINNLKNYSRGQLNIDIKNIRPQIETFKQRANFNYDRYPLFTKILPFIHPDKDTALWVLNNTDNLEDRIKKVLEILDKPLDKIKKDIINGYGFSKSLEINIPDFYKLPYKNDNINSVKDIEDGFKNKLSELDDIIENPEKSESYYSRAIKVQIDDDTYSIRGSFSNGNISISFSSEKYAMNDVNKGLFFKVLPKVIDSISYMFSDVEYNTISFLPVHGESSKGRDLRLKGYNIFAKRLFGQFSLVAENENVTTIPIPDAFKNRVHIKENMYQKERVERSKSWVDNNQSNAQYQLPQNRDNQNILFQKRSQERFAVSGETTMGSTSIMSRALNYIDQNIPEVYEIIGENFGFDWNEVQSQLEGMHQINLSRRRIIDFLSQRVANAENPEQKLQEIIQDRDTLLKDFSDINNFLSLRNVETKIESFETILNQFDSLPEGTLTTQDRNILLDQAYKFKEPMLIFKGLDGKRNDSGDPIIVHNVRNVTWGSQNFKDAETYAKFTGKIGMFLVEGKNVVDVKAPGNTPMSMLREVESQLIENSYSDVIRLDTVDGTTTDPHIILKGDRKMIGLIDPEKGNKIMIEDGLEKVVTTKEGAITNFMPENANFEENQITKIRLNCR